MPKQPKMPNMQQMLAQVEKMQRNIELAQESLKGETVEASAGGGAVKVTVSGDLFVKSIVIDPEAIDPEDPEMLAEMVIAAVNDGLRKAQELSAQRIDAATGGLPGAPLGLPGAPRGLPRAPRSGSRQAL